MSMRKISAKYYENCDKISDAKFEGETLYFTFSGTAREANVLRRIFFRDIPVMAISDVRFRQNVGVFHDEFLRHRLELIPVVADADDFDEKESVRFDLYCTGKKTDFVFSDKITNKDYPLMSGIPLTKLGPNHVIELEAYATKGFGRNHARWQAVTVSIFKKVPEKKNTFLFTVESVGVYTPKQLLKKALKIYV